MEPLAIISGIRTPFVKAFGPLANIPADELGRTVVQAVLKNADLPPTDIDEVIFGNVGSPAESANIARVIALKAGIPQDRPAHTVHRNCASGMESILSAWQIIQTGRANVVIAGGTESMSNVPLLFSREMQQWMMGFQRQKSMVGKFCELLRLRPKFLRPVSGLQLGLTDSTCGLNMGETAEILAAEFGITRQMQDEFAVESHRKAVAAWNSGLFDEEVTPVPAGSGSASVVTRDVGPRDGQSLAALARLKPIFRSPEGASPTITAGNSCPLTDGAAALIVTSISHAQSRGWKPMGFIRGHAIAGCDPRRMGLGPVFATHKLLHKTGRNLADFQRIELNEAFAAQVLACRSAFASDSFARQHLGRMQALGELPLEKMNVHGGAIALGHPVGTTGTRLVLTLLRSLHEQNLRNGLATLCVGGGQGVALWVDTAVD